MLSSLENLTQLDLDYNNIGDPGAEILSTLTNLTQLHLGNNKIGDKGIKALSKLINLKQLHLFDNSIGDQGAKALPTLKNLTQLHLDHTRISDQGAEAISTLNNLTQLDLSYNNIGDQGAQALSNLNNLTQLDLSYNNIGAKGLGGLLEYWLNRSENQYPDILSITGNGDFSSILPPEAIETSDTQAILAAYQRFKAVGVQYSYLPEKANRKELLEGVRQARRQLIGNEPPALPERENANKDSTTPTPPQKGGFVKALTSWPAFSAMCGLLAVIFAIAMYLLPSFEARVILGGLTGIFLLVTSFVAQLNPKYFYRRILLGVLAGGMVIQALGFALQAGFVHQKFTGFFKWKGTVDPSVWFFYSVVVVLVIGADLYQNRQS